MLNIICYNSFLLKLKMKLKDGSFHQILLLVSEQVLDSKSPDSPVQSYLQKRTVNIKTG